jgi:acylpyruvate hydrolase
MRIMRFSHGGRQGLAARSTEGDWRGLFEDSDTFPGFLEHLIGQSTATQSAGHLALLAGEPVDTDIVAVLPPLINPPKIICAGLNYAGHTAESTMAQPEFPTLFARFKSSLVGHGGAIVRPHVSEQLDFEGELVAIVGKGGRHIPAKSATNHIAGWSIFNDASVRDYQFKGAQWTLGKNFDATGAFGPVFVTAEELPPGGGGLKLETRLNGEVVQSASTADFIFDVATLISFISEAMTLEPGDLILTGTPAGVGVARKPPLWMKPGDVVEVEIEDIGVLTNRVVMESAGISAVA